MKIKLNIVPASGKTVEKEVEVEGTGVKVREALKAAGVSVSRKQRYTVKGKTVGPDDYIRANDKVKVETVTVTERASGS